MSERAFPVIVSCGVALAIAQPVAAQPAGGGDGAEPEPPSEQQSNGEDPAPSEASGPAGPWRLDQAVGNPPWLRLRATHRTRYEHLWNQFRAGVAGNDGVLVLRTTLLGELRFSPLVVGAELADSRLYLADSNTPLDTTLINPVELLQGYVGADFEDLFMPGASGRIRAGRLTMDVGSRRLVARNRFRNTINTFTGLDLRWTSPEKDVGRAFAVLPVHRRPDDEQGLRDNAIDFDRESFDRVFWGAFYESREWSHRLRLEAYLFGIHERDSADVATLNRRLYTPGLRVHRSARAGELDVEGEVALQAGQSRASEDAGDTQDLDHFAVFSHVAAGYTFDVPWQPRVELLHDYASGDADPDDGNNGRFDTLFGARRFEYGPTGIYGAFARSNINSPGARVELAPHAQVEAFWGYRAVWLAQARDVWTTSGVQDPSGGSGSFVGHQLEARLRFKPLAGDIEVQVGFAHTWLGELATSAPNANGQGDPSYVYTQVMLRI